MVYSTSNIFITTSKMEIVIIDFLFVRNCAVLYTLSHLNLKTALSKYTNINVNNILSLFPIWQVKK